MPIFSDDSLRFVTPTAIRRIARRAGIKRISLTTARNMKRGSHGQRVKHVTDKNGNSKNVPIKTPDVSMYEYLLKKLDQRLADIVNDASVCAQASGHKTILCRHMKMAVQRGTKTETFFGDCPLA